MESQGFVDKKYGRTLHGRSRAYIKVNRRDYSYHRRGFNVVVINRKTGKELQFEFMETNFFVYAVNGGKAIKCLFHMVISDLVLKIFPLMDNTKKLS